MFKVLSFTLTGLLLAFIVAPVAIIVAGAVLLVAGAIRLKTETLPLALYLNMATGDLEAALTAATILIIISLVTLLLLEKAGGNLRGGVKGL